jgi:hypothetical protein
MKVRRKRRITMRDLNRSFARLGKSALVMGVLTLTFQLAARAQEPVGPVKPVVVVNTPSQPVPVTGTITGVVTLGNTPNVNIANTPNVSIVNTPTVRIDPGSNAVVVAPRSTQLLLNTGVYDVSQGGYPATAPIDVSSFSRIRVVAFNQSDSDGPFSIFVSVRLPGGLVVSLDGANFGSLQPGQVFNRVYEVPGQSIQVNVGGNGPNRNGGIAVFGQ